MINFRSPFIPPPFLSIANVNEELIVKNFLKEKDQTFLTSGSKKLKDRISLTENPEVFIWGVVTHVIHAL